MNPTTLQLVIPTLWRPSGLAAALEEYLHSPAVERVVVIDNDPNRRPTTIEALSEHPKLLLLAQPQNLLVNPAWNLGMAQIHGTSTLVGILNDDILIPSSVLEALLSQAPPPGTVVGLVEHKVGSPLHKAPPSSPFALEPFPYSKKVSIGSQCRGFGSALFLRRGDFIPIPPSLQIWFGDDWILQRARRVLGLSSALIRIDRHITMTEMRNSARFRQQLARDKEYAPLLLGWDKSSERDVLNLKDGHERAHHHD